MNPDSQSIKKLAYVVFDGLTYLDFAGFYDPLSRLRSMKYIPDLEWDVCGFSSQITDNFGLKIKVDKVKPDLSGYDMVFVPGGFGTRALRIDDHFINWIKTISSDSLKVSVCTGSLILGSAGFLKGRRATTNYNEYDLLRPYCAEVVKSRIVDEGDLITAGAVASSLDLGLYICERLVGYEAKERIRMKMDYHG